MNHNRHFASLLLGIFCCFPVLATNVVVTIKPLHSLVAAITEGVLEPALLIEGMASPHTFSMRPSQRQMLESADVIVFAGEALESSFVPLLKRLEKKKLVIELAKLPGIRLRYFNASAQDEHQHHEAHYVQTGSLAWYDPHIWLDPSQMAVFVVGVSEHLSRLLPQHRGRLVENTNIVLDKLQKLDKTLKAEFMTVNQSPFMTYHDAYGYLVERYQLRYEGHFSTGHGQPLSAKQLKKIEKKIHEKGIQCLFEEPQYKSPLIERVKGLTGAKSAELDPLGQSLTASSSQYFQMMARLSSLIRGCLSQP